MKKNILIICDNNSLYSKLAEAYLKKYAGHWKNIFSAGINISGKVISPDLEAILKQDNLETTIDYALKSIKEYNLNSFDYIIALTENAAADLKQILPENRIILLNIDHLMAQKKQSMSDINETIQTELLKFVKNGPIKRWLEID